MATRRKHRGAAMVELAIVLPLLLALTFGLIEYGWMFFKVAQVNQAARHGSRTAIRPAATEEEVNEAIAEVMEGAGLGDSDYEIVLSDLEVEVGEAVTVEVQVDYESNIDLTGLPFLPIPDAVFGRVTMSKEGP